MHLYCLGQSTLTPIWEIIGFPRKGMFGDSPSTSTQCYMSQIDNFRDPPHTSYVVIVSIAVLVNPIINVLSSGKIYTSHRLLTVFQH